MSMNIGSPEEDGSESPMTEINTTPLVDVMLVLLIIFLITVPVVIQTVPLTLPTVTNLPTTTKPENVLLSVDANCDTYWGQTKVETKQELLDRGVDVPEGRHRPAGKGWRQDRTARSPYPR